MVGRGVELEPARSRLEHAAIARDACLGSELANGGPTNGEIKCQL